MAASRHHSTPPRGGSVLVAGAPPFTCAAVLGRSRASGREETSDEAGPTRDADATGCAEPSACAGPSDRCGPLGCAGPVGRSGLSPSRPVGTGAGRRGWEPCGVTVAVLLVGVRAPWVRAGFWACYLCYPVLPASALEASGGQPGHDVALEDEEEQDRRDGGDRKGRDQHVLRHARVEGVEADVHRLLRPV